VVANETQQGRSWDEAKIKTLTGGDKLTGRYMRGDFFDFTPSHKLMIVGNHKPRLRNVDDAIRRRFLLVPFTVSIPPHERDPLLTDKLKAEWPAILRWMVDGCLEWRRDGLGVPACVHQASDAYFDDQDVVQQWADDWIDSSNPDAFTASRELFASWKLWAEQRNTRVGSERAFVQALADKGFRQFRTRSTRGFSGIRLKPHDGKLDL
jgi:putative DNA primase/helicase